MTEDRATDPALDAWVRAARAQLARLQDAMVLLQGFVRTGDQLDLAPAQAQEVIRFCDELNGWFDAEPPPVSLLEAESELRAAAAVLRNAAFVVRRDPARWAGGAQGWRRSLAELLARVASHVAGFLDLVDDLGGASSSSPGSPP
jgi:hypothetical protein